MDLLDLIYPDPETDTGRFAKDLGKIYFRTRLLDKGMDWLFQNAMPTTTAAYSKATNEDEPFITKAPTLAGKQVLQQINEDMIAARPMRESIYGALPQSNARGMLGLGISTGAKNVISNLRGIGRFFGR